MEHQGTKTIETERLILRKFTADDLSAIFHNWTSDEKDACVYGILASDYRANKK